MVHLWGLGVLGRLGSVRTIRRGPLSIRGIHQLGGLPRSHSSCIREESCHLPCDETFWYGHCTYTILCWLDRRQNWDVLIAGKLHRPPFTAFHLGVVALKETKCVHGVGAGGDVTFPLQIFDRHRARDFPFQLHLSTEEIVCCFIQIFLLQGGNGMYSRMTRANHQSGRLVVPPPDPLLRLLRWW